MAASIWYSNLMNDIDHVLLHVCCAGCAAACIDRLLANGYHVSLFYSNSNINTEDEFLKRREDALKLSTITGLKIYEDPYDHQAWLKVISGFENEPEKGERCKRCFEYNLGRTAQKAAELNIPHFTTTLTVSPHKISKVLFSIGERFPGFLPLDFKKQDGFKRSMELSRKYEFYRQSYCGCEFSIT